MGSVGGWWELLSGLVRPVLVVVNDILAQRGEQVSFVLGGVDRHPMAQHDNLNLVGVMTSRNQRPKLHLRQT